MSPFSPINSIADLRDLARRRLPRALFDYIDRGSYDQLTLARNRADFDELELRQRVMVDVSRLSLDTMVLGERWNMPFGIAPTGLTGLFHRDGEIRAARAAHAAGVPFCLSTMSICAIEDVRAATPGDALVPVVLHARPLVHRSLDGAGASGALSRARAHARSAAAGAAAARSQRTASRFRRG